MFLLKKLRRFFVQMMMKDLVNDKDEINRKIIIKR